MLVTGLYLVPFSIFDDAWSKFPGDLGDARFNNYVLEHGHQFVTGNVDSFWDAPVMYPQKNVIAFSDNLLGSMPFYSAFRVCGANRESSYQYWLLAMFVLNYCCCFWAAYKFSGNVILASVGAYVFAFSIFILGNLNNVQVFPRFIVPLVVYWTWRYLMEKNFKHFLLSILGIVYQFYCGMYLGVFLVYILFFLIVAHFVFYRNWSLFTQFRSLKTLSKHFGLAAGAGLLLYPLFMPYITASAEFIPVQFYEIQNNIPQPRSYFFTSNASLTWSTLSEHGILTLKNWWMHFLWIGAVPWIAILVSPILFLSRLESQNKKTIGAVLLALFLSIIFCLSINESTFYGMIFRLPGFSSIRAVTRILNVEIVLFVLLLIVVGAEFVKRFRFAKWVVLSLPVLVVADNLIIPDNVTSYSTQESRKEIDHVKTIISQQYDSTYSAVAFIPSAHMSNIVASHLNVMLAAQELHIPCVNAYSGYLPHYFIEFELYPSVEALEYWFENSGVDRNDVQIIYENPDEHYFYRRLITDSNSCAYVMDNKVIAISPNNQNSQNFLVLTLDSTHCAIRGTNGFFLSVLLDQSKEIAAVQSEIHEQETFEIVALENNKFALKAANEKFISVDSTNHALFARADSIGRNEIFSFTR
jgi:hypothetical protein